MKLSVLFLSLMSVSTAFGSQLVDNLLAGKDQTLVVYGTSLTAAGKWVSETRTWLNSLNPGRAKVTLINGGQSGKNSLVGLAKLDSVVIANNPDTVIIEFSMNDAFQFPDQKQRVSLEDGAKNLETMISRIKAALPKTEIIVQTMNPAWDNPGGRLGGTNRPQLPAYYEGYRKVALKLGVLLIDNNKNWSELQIKDKALFEKYIPDGVHPSAEGSIAVAMPEIKKVLGDKRL